nr:PaaI family thioesterase [Chitinivorax sp. B]
MTDAHTDLTARTQTFSWEDPMIGAAAARSLSGLEYLQRILNKEIPVPPIMELIGFRFVTVEQGLVAFEFEPAEPHYNPIGTVHGGIISTLLDSAMGCCIHTMLPAGVGYSTLEIKVNFVRPVSVKTGTLRCEAKVIHTGSKAATSEGRLVDRDGKLYAHGTTTCIILN